MRRGVGRVEKVKVRLRLEVRAVDNGIAAFQIENARNVVSKLFKLCT